MASLYRIYTEGGAQEWHYHSGRRKIKMVGSVAYIAKPIKRQKINLSLQQQEATIETTYDHLPWSYFMNGTSGTNIWVEIKDYDTFKTLFLGIVVGIELSGGTGICRVTLKNRFVFGSAEIPDHPFGPQCNYRLFGPKCKVNPDLYSLTIEASSVNINTVNGTISHPSLATKPDGFFNFGSVTRGIEKVFITRHIGDTVWIFNSFVAPSGSTMQFSAGCDQTLATCQSKFNNNVRFGGYTQTPIANPVKDTIEL